MSVNISVQVKLDAARALHQLDQPTAESEALLRLQKELCIKLKPTFHDTKDHDLLVWFTAEVPNSAVAEQVTAHLQNLSAVTAAFVKPPDELPR